VQELYVLTCLKTIQRPGNSFHSNCAALELFWLLNLRALHFKKGPYLSCSVWSQSANLSTAKIYSGQEIYLRSFSSSDFQDKYKWEVRSGFSLALAFL